LAFDANGMSLRRTVRLLPTLLPKTRTSEAIIRNISRSTATTWRLVTLWRKY